MLSEILLGHPGIIYSSFAQPKDSLLLGRRAPSYKTGSGRTLDREKRAVRSLPGMASRD